MLSIVLHCRHNLSSSMKTFRRLYRKGFTLIELLVVIFILGIMMTMASSILRDTGKGSSMESAVMQLESMVHEARAMAMGNETCTRLIIVNEPRDASRHLRFMNIQLLAKNDKSYDGTDVAPESRWTTVSNGVLLPQGIFFSPFYSRPLEGDHLDTMLGDDTARLSNKGYTRVVYAEFDEKGRFIHPQAGPDSATLPQRLVLIPGRLNDSSKRSKDGVLPAEFDSRKRPLNAGGLVVYPSGNTVRLRTIDQIESD